MDQFKRIGVVGAGMMGSEIALVFALNGRPTILSDQNADAARKALGRLAGVLDKGAARSLWTKDAADGALRNLSVADTLEDYGDRDLVIEAVFEDVAVKGEVFQRLDRVLAQGAVIASNTSSISITHLSSFLPETRRARFLGTHFFSPVSRMPLVEVIPGTDTDPAVADAVSEALAAIGKTPIRVKDVVGFAINRILHIFWIEAMRLVEEGVCSPKDIDIGCKLALGHPVGPFELMDGVTNNLTLDVEEILYRAYGERFLPRPLIKQMVAAGHNGRKAGRGWYRYDAEGKRI